MWNTSNSVIDKGNYKKNSDKQPRLLQATKRKTAIIIITRKKKTTRHLRNNPFNLNYENFLLVNNAPITKCPLISTSCCSTSEQQLRQCCCFFVIIAHCKNFYNRLPAFTVERVEPTKRFLPEIPVLLALSGRFESETLPAVLGRCCDVVAADIGRTFSGVEVTG